MKRVAKAFLSLALIAAIVLGNAHFVYADGRNKNDSSSRTVTGKTSVINAQYSSDQNQEKALDDILMADYSYVIKENESNTAVVDMKVTLYTRSDKYLAEFSGAVDLIELPSGFAFWEGPLDGTFLLDDKEIRIIVGFLQKKNSEDICLSFTFCVEEEERGEYPVLFSIGEGFITDAVNEEILSFQNDYTTGDNEESNHEDIDISPETNNRSTTLLFSSTRSTLAGVEIQTTKCYFEYATNRVLIGLKSNTNYATQYYSSMASSLIATYVNHLKWYP